MADWMRTGAFPDFWNKSCKDSGTRRDGGSYAAHFEGTRRPFSLLRPLRRSFRRPWVCGISAARGLFPGRLFDGFDRHPAAGFGGEGDVGPAAGLGDDLAERAGRRVDDLGGGAGGVGVERGFFRDDDGLFGERGELGVVGEIAPAEDSGGNEDGAEHERGDGGDAARAPGRVAGKTSRASAQSQTPVQQTACQAVSGNLASAYWYSGRWTTMAPYFRSMKRRFWRASWWPESRASARR